MKRRHALSVVFAALMGALAIAALPALAGARDGEHHRGHDRSEHRHHHGNRGHHENVGRISAFDATSGTLTITRFGGGTISGLVTGSTEIKCEGREGRATFSRDNGGRGEEEPGDDHGEGLEPGDDDENDNRACTSADLTAGAVVHEVDRDFHEGVVSFNEIELGHPS